MTFVLSDPIPVSPDTAYLVESRMRYALQSDSDAVYFTVLQFDSDARQLELKEVAGEKGDNHWSWQPKQLLFHTSPEATFIRIRFGLIAETESYLDVDALGTGSPFSW